MIRLGSWKPLGLSLVGSGTQGLRPAREIREIGAILQKPGSAILEVWFTSRKETISTSHGGWYMLRKPRCNMLSSQWGGYKMKKKKKKKKK